MTPIVRENTPDLLSVEGLTKTFGGVSAITDVSFVIPAKTITAIVGPNGAGKTTLLDLLTGFHRPDTGTIRLAGIRPLDGTNGEDITGLRPDRLCAAGIARTFDPPRPFAGLNAETGVMIAALMHNSEVAVAQQWAREVLERLGLESLYGRPAAHLSLVERKGLDLARALATRPRLLVLDEPLTGLTVAERDGLIDLLQTLCQRRSLTILLTGHDPLPITALTDRFLTLDHGELKA